MSFRGRGTVKMLNAVIGAVRRCISVDVDVSDFSAEELLKPEHVHEERAGSDQSHGQTAIDAVAQQSEEVARHRSDGGHVDRNWAAVLAVA